MNKIKSIFNWSGGKDSSLALYHILQEGKYDIHSLLTTVNTEHNRISMHGVRVELLHAQAEAIGLPVTELRLPSNLTMDSYNQAMRKNLEPLAKQGITHSIFGDIFLEDLRQYREDRLAEVGLKGHFPLWKRDTTELVHEFIDLGFKTVVVCTKANLLGKEFAGRVIDKDFLKDLPKGVDPCGENGEFHTFVYDGPIFKKPIPIEIGEVIFRTYETPKNTDNTDQGEVCVSDTPTDQISGFYYCDLIPK